MLLDHYDSCFLVAEIGLNHNGDLSIAKQLIKEAKDAGFDCVKFQKRTVEVVYTKEELDAPRESPWGTTNREQKMGLEFGKNEYDEIDRYCREVNIKWTASPWDVESVSFLSQYDIPFVKVASASLTDTVLLDSIISLGYEIWLSTGMSTNDQVWNAVHYVKNPGGFIGCLLHCTSTYPCPYEEINLRRIQFLRNMYNGIPIGYSGHEVGINPSVVAAALGARVIERHITLSRAMYGSDQAASLDPAGFRRLCRYIHEIRSIMGDGATDIYSSEIPVLKKLRKADTLTCL